MPTMPRKRRSNLLFYHFVARVCRQRLLALVAVASLATAAAAQEFRTDPVNAEAKRNITVAQIAVKNPARYTADKAKFEEYFTKCYFPEMTQTDADILARLGDARYKLFNQYLWETTNPDLQSDLTALALKAMAGIVTAENPSYHPAVRYNAILIIGMLDEQYAVDAGANSKPPKPLPKATTALTTIVDRATTTDKFPPPVILGALIGLERHAQFRDALAPGAADAMTAALVKLVNNEKPIQEMDREAYSWMRLRAASALAQLGGVGAKNEVHDALIELIGDFKSLDDRCASAALLEKLKYDGAKVDGAAAAEQTLKLASDVAKAERKRAEEFQEAGGSGFAPGRGERFMPNFGSGEELETFPRAHVLARLTDLRAGLRAVKPIVPKDAQKKFDAILAAIEPAREAVADKDTVELNVASAMITMAGAIEAAAAADEKPAADAEEAFE